MQQIVQPLTQIRQLLVLLAAVAVLVLAIGAAANAFGIRVPVSIGAETLAYLAGAVWLAK